MLSASLCLARIAVGSLVVVLTARQVVDVAREKVVTVEVARKMMVVLVGAAIEVCHVDTYIFFLLQSKPNLHLRLLLCKKRHCLPVISLNLQPS